MFKVGFTYSFVFYPFFSVNLLINIDVAVFPTTLTEVAGISITILMIIIITNTYTRILYELTISISTIKLPSDTPNITIPLKNAIKIAPITLPYIFIIVFISRQTFLTSFLTLMFFVISKLLGKLAKLDCVASTVAVRINTFLLIFYLFSPSMLIPIPNNIANIINGSILLILSSLL